MENTYVAVRRDDSYLAHHGVKGQKWGVRRYQNPDGSYKSAAAEKYRAKAEASKAARAETDNYLRKVVKAGGVKDYLGKTVLSAKEVEAARKKAYKQNTHSMNTSLATADYKQNRTNYVKSQSIGKKVAKTILMGPFATRSYNTMRSTGMDRSEAAVRTMVGSLLLGPTGSALYGAQAKYTYINKRTGQLDRESAKKDKAK